MTRTEFQTYLTEVDDWIHFPKAVNRSDGHACSMMDVMEQHPSDLADKWKQWLRKANALDAISHIPIMAICGGMNAGKSTLTASLLSPERAPFVLRGGGMQMATHRFVMWCPTSWKEDPDRQACLQDLIRAAFEFEGRCEELSSDLNEAHAQYNARHHDETSLHLPLVGFDAALDEHGVAILDCPDLDSPHDPDVLHQTADIRRDAIKKASRLCSGFIALATQSNWQDAGWMDLIRFVNEISPQGTSPTLCITKTEGNPKALFADVANRLVGYDLSADRFMYIHSPLDSQETGGVLDIRYLDEKENPFHIPSLYPPSDKVECGSRQAWALREEVELLRDETLNFLNDRLNASDSLRKYRLEAIQNYICKYLCDRDGHLRLIVTVSLAEDLIGDIGRRYRFSPTLHHDGSFADDPKAVIDLLKKVLPRQGRRAGGRRIPRLRLEHLSDWVTETMECDTEKDLLHERFAGDEGHIFWTIHWDESLNGSEYTEEFADHALIWAREFKIKSAFRLWKPSAKIISILSFLSKACLDPNKPDQQAVVSGPEICRIIENIELDLGEENSFVEALDELAQAQVSAIQNWLADLMGLPREDFLLTPRVGDPIQLTAQPRESLLPLEPLPPSILPVLFYANPEMIRSAWPCK